MSNGSIMIQAFCTLRLFFLSFFQFHSNLPGPGTYGEGGIPWAAMEGKAKMAASTVGVLEGGGAKIRKLPTTGCDLAPGQYQYPGPIQQLLSKEVSKRGPYDLFTGERYKPTKLLVRFLHVHAW